MINYLFTTETLMLIASAVIFAALMHHLVFTYGRPAATAKLYSFFGKESWVRKYARHPKSNDEIYLTLPPPRWAKWYYKFFGVRHKERFPGSATFLVAFTDGYHFLQWLFSKMIILSITQSPTLILIYWGAWSMIMFIYFTIKRKLNG